MVFLLWRFQTHVNCLVKELIKRMNLQQDPTFSPLTNQTLSLVIHFPTRWQQESLLSPESPRGEKRNSGEQGGRGGRWSNREQQKTRGTVGGRRSRETRGQGEAGEAAGSRGGRWISRKGGRRSSREQGGQVKPQEGGQGEQRGAGRQGKQGGSSPPVAQLGSQGCNRRPRRLTGPGLGFSLFHLFSHAENWKRKNAEWQELMVSHKYHQRQFKNCSSLSEMNEENRRAVASFLPLTTLYLERTDEQCFFYCIVIQLD